MKLNSLELCGFFQWNTCWTFIIKILHAGSHFFGKCYLVWSFERQFGLIHFSPINVFVFVSINCLISHSIRFSFWHGATRCFALIYVGGSTNTFYRRFQWLYVTLTVQILNDSSYEIRSMFTNWRCVYVLDVLCICVNVYHIQNPLLNRLLTSLSLNFLLFK